MHFLRLGSLAFRWSELHVRNHLDEVAAATPEESLGGQVTWLQALQLAQLIAYLALVLVDAFSHSDSVESQPRVELLVANLRSSWRNLLIQEVLDQEARAHENENVDGQLPHRCPQMFVCVRAVLLFCARDRLHFLGHVLAAGLSLLIFQSLSCNVFDSLQRFNFLLGAAGPGSGGASVAFAFDRVEPAEVAWKNGSAAEEDASTKMLELKLTQHFVV